jgi:hypothetical protein
MKYTRENIVEGINAKLNKLVDENPILSPMCNVYRTILLNYPIEIEQNVLEWINNLPITKVDCHGISIKEVMERKQVKDVYFPIVVQNFIRFKDNGFVGTMTCYEGL